ncbi:MAG: SIMPL domain-containing protein [Firmicutes bacterium]|nr:SIMPL domain-containing protein [Bacillota bacterium]
MKKKILISIALIAFVLTLGITSNLQFANASALVDEEYKLAREYKHHCKKSQILVVTGTASTTVQPDFAIVNFSVETSNKNLENAQNENATTMQNIKSALSLHNLSEKNLTTNWFNIYPEHDYYNGEKSTGHRVSYQFSLKVKEFDNVGKIIDILITNGANMISGAQFGIEYSSTAYIETLTKAVENAKQKANILSNITNIDDLKIVTIKEMPNGHIEFARYDSAMYCGTGNTSIMQNGIDITATVKVVFKG